MTTTARSFTVAELARCTSGELVGPGDLVIDGLETVLDARPGQLTFVGDAKHAQCLATSRASAAIVSKALASSIEQRDERALIFVPNADVAMISVLELFAPREQALPPGVHPTAVIDPSATLGADVRVGPFVTVARGATIGAGSTLHAGVRIYEHVSIGERCMLHANVAIRERCVLGRGVILHGGVQIGTDGFGYRAAPDGRGILKIPHNGNVVIEDLVEIGANTCVDRGKFGATTIGAMTKIDNLVQIGHNCRVGRGCMISGLAGLAGSATLGDGALIGGGVGIADHVTIGKGAKIAARSGVMDDIPDGETWGGYPAKEFRRAAQEVIVMRFLIDNWKKVKRLLTSLGGDAT